MNKNLVYIISSIGILGLLAFWIIGRIELDTVVLGSSTLIGILYGLYKKLETDELESKLLKEVDTQKRFADQIYILQSERDELQTRNNLLKDEVNNLDKGLKLLSNQYFDLQEENKTLNSKFNLKTEEATKVLDSKDEVPKVIKRKPRAKKSNTNNK